MPNLNNQNLESYIMFYGRQKCQPDEFFQGDNLRKNDIFYTLLVELAALLLVDTTQSN